MVYDVAMSGMAQDGAFNLPPQFKVTATMEIQNSNMLDAKKPKPQPEEKILEKQLRAILLES